MNGRDNNCFRFLMQKNDFYSHTFEKIKLLNTIKWPIADTHIISHNQQHNVVYKHNFVSLENADESTHNQKSGIVSATTHEQKFDYNHKCFLISKPNVEHTKASSCSIRIHMHASGILKY